MFSVPLPPRGLASLSVRTVEVSPTNLYRISRPGSGEPFFGRSASNRFDDPSRVKARRYGTCYLGTTLEVAIAETVLHDEMPVRGRFEVSASEIENRHCVRFKGDPLVLIDLTGTALKSLVGSGALSTIVPYDVSQRWSRAMWIAGQRQLPIAANCGSRPDAASASPRWSCRWRPHAT